jgi:hypothetical protein
MVSVAVGQDERIDLAHIVLQALRPEFRGSVNLDVMPFDNNMDARPGAPVAWVLQVETRVVMGGQRTALRRAAAHDEDFHSVKKRANRPESKSCLTE